MYSNKGLSRVQLLITAGGLILISGLLIYAVVDTNRRARDAERVSQLRQIEFDLIDYRNRHASYPESLEELYDGAGVPGYGYGALPIGCRADSATLCNSYVITFSLEGRVGILSGGVCESSPDGIACFKQ